MSSLQQVRASSVNEHSESLIGSHDLFEVLQPLQLNLNPEGSSIVLTVQRVSRNDNQTHSDLYCASISGQEKGLPGIFHTGGLRQLTFGDHKDEDPKFSPDGRLISFLSNRYGSIQVFLQPVDGGSEYQLTSFEGTVYSHCWAPDGRSLVVAMQASSKEDDELAFRIDTLEWRLNGSGNLDSNHRELYVVDVETGAARLLLSDGCDNDDPVFTPDGNWIVFSSNKSLEPDRDFLNAQLWKIPVQGGPPQQLTRDFSGPCTQPSISPDGTSVAFRFRPPSNSTLGWLRSRLYVVPLTGGTPQEVCPAVDIDVEIGVHSDVYDSVPEAPPQWSSDGVKLYALATRDGEVLPYEFDLQSGFAKPVLDYRGCVTGFELNHASGELICIAGNHAVPGELISSRIGSSGLQYHSTLSDWLEQRQPAEFMETWLERDGYRVQGWIMKPPDFEPERQYPAVLYIHGGPHSAYGDIYFHEFQFLAAQGYVVGFCNPTGSLGYGEEFKAHIKVGWGGRDADDVLAFAQHMLNVCPQIGQSRMAVAGGSYGGYLAAMLIGRTDMFACAIVERGVSNMVSHQGDSDTMTIHTAFGFDLKDHAFKNEDFFWEMSPLKNAHRIRTPTLFIAAAKDLRVTTSQTDQLYVALQLQRTPARMLVFKSEDHQLGTTGRADRQIYRLNAIKDWLDEHLM